MLDAIFQKICSVWDYMVVKGGLVISFLLSTFLTAIGYPSQAIIFIVSLIVIDILTRFHTEIYKHYGYFTIKLFFKGWKEKVLTSRKLKNGLFTKIFFYSIILYIAHQTSIIEQLYFGQFISNFLLSSIIVLDLISIFENLSDSDVLQAKFIKQFLEKQRDKLMEKDD